MYLGKEFVNNDGSIFSKKENSFSIYLFHDAQLFIHLKYHHKP